MKLTQTSHLEMLLVVQVLVLVPIHIPVVRVCPRARPTLLVLLLLLRRRHLLLLILHLRMM